MGICQSKQDFLDSKMRNRGEGANQQKESRIEGLHLSVELSKDCHKEGVIGGKDTLVALKSTNSYLVGTWGKGIILTENGAEIYSGSLPVEGKSLRDIIYITPLNCYILSHDKKLYRKDIDDKPAYLYMDVESGNKLGSCFRYSNIHQRLIMIKEETNLSVVNLETKEVEIELKKSAGNYIADFRVFGEQEDRVISLTHDGNVFVCEIDYAEKKGSVKSHHTEILDKKRDESIRSISLRKK